MTTMTDQVGAPVALNDILRGYSVELTSRDRKSLELAPELLQPGTEVFVAALPGDSVDAVVAACSQLKKAGLTPVPHVVARNIESVADLKTLVSRLVKEAGVDRALALGGDRDKPEGDLVSSLQTIETGVFQDNGIGKIFIGAYPEGHPKISEAVLDKFRADKLAAAEKAGLDVTIVSQFAFASEPIIALAEHMRRQGVKAPFRVGVAGPADRGLLLKYAIICGVGNSINMLKKRMDLAKNTLSGETPEALVREVAAAQAQRPELGVSGIHFFTFGSLARSAQWAQAQIA